MKYASPFLLLLALLQLNACSFFNGSSQDSVNSRSMDGDSILISETITDSLTQFRIDIRIPLVHSFEPAINDSINKQFTSPFAYTLEKGPLSYTAYAQAFRDSFYAEHRRINQDFPEFGASYEWSMSAELLGVHPEYISGVSSTYSYTGGAHGGRSTNYFVLDSKTGRKLTRMDVVSDTTQLNVVAEKLFRQKMELAPNADLSENGFWFDGNRFYLNENFAFSKGGNSLLFLFNEYEVTAYAAGQIELEIPLSQLNGILKIAKETNLQ